MGDVNIYNSRENGSAYIRAKTFTNFLNTLEELRQLVYSEIQVDQEQLEQKIQILKALLLEILKGQPKNFNLLCTFFVITFNSESSKFPDRLPSSLNIFQDDAFIAELKKIRPRAVVNLKRYNYRLGLLWRKYLLLELI